MKGWRRFHLLAGVSYVALMAHYGTPPANRLSPFPTQT